MPSKAAERIVRLRSVTGPILAGVNSIEPGYRSESVMRKILIDERDDVAAMQRSIGIAELGLVAAAEVAGARSKIGKRP